MRPILALLIILIPQLSFADLQNVQVGGSIRIRGNWYSSAAGPDSLTARNPYFQPITTPSFRPGVNPLAGLRYAAQPGRLSISSAFDWNDSGPSVKWFEQRTRLNARADFTDNVSAFIEFESYDVWGEDYRSNYLTGIDSRASTSDDVEIYQSYIDADKMLGRPIRLRIGRQELKFGSGWLVAPNDTASLFYGTSFDGIRATYATDKLSIDAFWTKLAEGGPLEENGDVDFSGIYASYLGIKNVTLDAYCFWLRDAGALADTYSGPLQEGFEDLLNLDDYDPTNLYTVGLRGAGTLGHFDFDAELAYQFGNADAVGATFANAAGPFGKYPSPYGPDDADWNTWGANLTAGYTFQAPWSPRVFFNGAYFGGEDNRDVDFVQWLGALFDPFWHARPSVSFNRLFSNWEYTEFFENTDFSNGWIAKVGISAKPTDNLQLLLTASHCAALDPYQAPFTVWLLDQRFTVGAPLSFISHPNDKDIGTEIELIATYNYSQDLTFEAGYSHLFTGDGLAQGNFTAGNGLIFTGGTASNNADYLYCETKLTF